MNAEWPGSTDVHVFFCSNDTMCYLLKKLFTGKCDDLASLALNFSRHCEHCGPSWLLILYSTLRLEGMVEVEVLVDCCFPVLIVI